MKAKQPPYLKSIKPAADLWMLCRASQRAFSVYIELLLVALAQPYVSLKGRWRIHHRSRGDHTGV